MVIFNNFLSSLREPAGAAGAVGAAGAADGAACGAGIGIVPLGPALPAAI